MSFFFFWRAMSFCGQLDDLVDTRLVKRNSSSVLVSLPPRPPLLFSRLIVVFAVVLTHSCVSTIQNYFTYSSRKKKRITAKSTFTMGLTHEQTQRVKTAFLSYAQGQPKVSDAMIDQLICGAIPGLSWEQLQAKKAVRKVGADGYDLGSFFAVVNSDPAYIAFIEKYFPPAPEKEKEPEVDALALKTAKGF